MTAILGSVAFVTGGLAVTEHGDRAPWYVTKTQPSTADMIAKLRRVLIAAQYRPSHPTSQHSHKSTPSNWPGRTPAA
jgi:hypothetical protein